SAERRIERAGVDRAGGGAALGAGDGARPPLLPAGPGAALLRAHLCAAGRVHRPSAAPRRALLGALGARAGVGRLSPRLAERASPAALPRRRDALGGGALLHLLRACLPRLAAAPAPPGQRRRRREREDAEEDPGSALHGGAIRSKPEASAARPHVRRTEGAPARARRLLRLPAGSATTGVERFPCSDVQCISVSCATARPRTRRAASRGSRSTTSRA